MPNFGFSGSNLFSESVSIFPHVSLDFQVACDCSCSSMSHFFVLRVDDLLIGGHFDSVLLDSFFQLAAMHASRLRCHWHWWIF